MDDTTKLTDKQLIFLHTMKKAFVQKLKAEIDEIVEEIEKRALKVGMDSIEFYTKNV